MVGLSAGRTCWSHCGGHDLRLAAHHSIGAALPDCGLGHRDGHLQDHCIDPAVECHEEGVVAPGEWYHLTHLWGAPGASACGWRAGAALADRHLCDRPGRVPAVPRVLAQKGAHCLSTENLKHCSMLSEASARTQPLLSWMRDTL